MQYYCVHITSHNKCLTAAVNFESPDQHCSVYNVALPECCNERVHTKQWRTRLRGRTMSFWIKGVLSSEWHKSNHVHSCFLTSNVQCEITRIAPEHMESTPQCYICTTPQGCYIHWTSADHTHPSATLCMPLEVPVGMTAEMGGSCLLVTLLPGIFTVGHSSALICFTTISSFGWLWFNCV